MTTATDRPDPRCCRGCGETEAGCENKRLFRSTRCCPACAHDQDDEEESA